MFQHPNISSGKMFGIKRNKQQNTLSNRTPAFIFSQVGDMALEVVFAVVIIVVGALILNGLGTGLTAGSQASNTVNAGSNLLNNVTTQFPLTGTVIGLMILLAVVVFFLGRSSTGKTL